jgi:hypothetical protein
MKKEQMQNLLIGALEGGSNYWYEIKEFRNRKPKQEEPYLPSYITTPFSRDGALIICDNDSYEGDKVLDLKALKNGAKIMEEKYPSHYADVLKENDDSTTADVYLQCCLYGEIIFG